MESEFELYKVGAYTKAVNKKQNSLPKQKKYYNETKIL